MPHRDFQRVLQYRLLPALILLALLGLGIAFWFAGSGGTNPKADNAGQAAASPELQVKFHQDLRAPDLDSSILEPIGEEVRFEPAGVRITLSNGNGVPPPAGLKTNVTIHGDFEITGSYEILKADRPTNGYGVGVSLYAAIDPNTNDAVSLSRRLMPDGTTLFMSNRMTPEKDGLKHNYKAIPSRAAVGKLRLQRVGSKVRFLIADGGHENFVPVDEVEFSTKDVCYVQLGGNTGGSPSGLDLRLLDFTLRAGKVDDREDFSADTSTAGPPKAGVKGGLAAAVFLGLVLTLAAILGVRRYVRQRRRLGQMAGRGPALEKLAQPKKASASVIFSCSGCGKRLRAGAKRSAPKVKCPLCGKIMANPAAGAYKPGRPT